MALRNRHLIWLASAYKLVFPLVIRKAKRAVWHVPTIAHGHGGTPILLRMASTFE